MKKLYFPWAVEISFLHTKRCGNVIPVRNEEISPYNFSINPLKKSSYINEKVNEKSVREQMRLSPNKKSANLMGICIVVMLILKGSLRLKLFSIPFYKNSN